MYLFILSFKYVFLKKKILFFFNHPSIPFDFFHNKQNYFFFNYIKNILYNTLHFTHYLIFFWFKLTFRGKGFRVRKFLKTKKITFNFGRSHWTKLSLNQKIFFINKIRRQNYIWATNHLIDFFLIIYIIKLVKPINRYTKRGLRLKKQFIKKRFGKISQMISSLHF